LKESFIRKWSVVFILSLALAIILIDATLLNVSLATIIRDLNTNIQSIQWVITAYSLTIAALMITGGRLGDLFGRKKMFIIGAATFAVGSFIASISHNVPTMIMGESIIEGVGAALMMPATASLLVSKYKGRDRGIAFGIWGGVAAAATAIGPILGGYLTTYYSWRWGFRINVFVAALLIAGSFLITEYKDTREKPSLDWVGVFLSSVGLLSLVFGIIESSTYGWIKAKDVFVAFGHSFTLGGYSITVPTVAFGLVLLILFGVWESNVEKRGVTPLVSLHLFRNRQFTASMVTTGIISLGQAGLIFSIPVFMQAVRGADAFHTGLVMLPMSLTALFIAPLAGAFVHKISPKRVVQIGLLSSTIGYIILATTLNVNSSSTSLILPFVFMGLGMGATMSSISNLTLSAVSPEQSGEASGVNNTFRQLGGTLGTAVIGAILISTISTNLATGIDNSKVIPPVAKPAIASAVSNQTSNVEFNGGAQIGSNISKTIKDEIVNISHTAITDANKQSIGYTALLSALSLLVAFFIPGGKNIEIEKDIAVKPKNT